MSGNSYDIFISYKRKSLPMANNLYYRLTTRGYSTFFDLEEMGRDNFNAQLLNYIDNAKDVFVILEEGSLDACKRKDWENDWFCHEIAFALEKKKNIIPILLNDYKMPSEVFFPNRMKELSFKNAPEFNFSFFEAYLDKLIEKEYLLSMPNLQGRITSVFKFYSNENCQVFKEGKLVCSLEGKSDKPYFLPVTRKGDYRFKAVNDTSCEMRILDVKIDSVEEKSIEIKWGNDLNVKKILCGKNKVWGIAIIATLLLAMVFTFISLWKVHDIHRSISSSSFKKIDNEEVSSQTVIESGYNNQIDGETFNNKWGYEDSYNKNEIIERTNVNTGDVVDLGLSVKWASCNVGASSPEQAGGYFAWGEINEKDEYSIETYAYTYKEYGYTEAIRIASDISGTKYDAATKKIGKAYRIPTKEEMKELIRDCTWTYKVYNGIHGFVVTGRTGNSIFIPSVGGKHNMAKENVSYYWTSTAGEYGTPYSLFISTYGRSDGEIDLVNYVSVDHGLPIRPVSNLSK